jgi:hypothetical protein
MTSRGHREFNYQVHGDTMPWSGRNRERLQQTSWRLILCLVPLTRVATLNVLLDMVFQLRPPVNLLD